MIKTGRYGQVNYDPAGGNALAQIISINAWKASFKTDFEDVSCFGDTNKVYIPGLMDISGSFEGFWNSAELTLFKAAMQPTPGMLQLMPNSTEPAFFWKGLGYMDAEIDCSMTAPKITGEFKAAGPWTVPGMVAATGATGGTGTGTFTPAGAVPPANLAALQASGIVATPATAWAAGSFILLGDGSKAHWTGTAWAAGPA